MSASLYCCYVVSTVNVVVIKLTCKFTGRGGEKDMTHDHEAGLDYVCLCVWDEKAFTLADSQVG